MLDPKIAKRVLSKFSTKDRLSILDAVNLGRNPKLELETWGLFCACLAWGGLAAKRKLLIPFYENLPNSFTEFVMKPSREMLRGIYRTDVGSLQLEGLCLAIGDLLKEYESILKLVSESKSIDHAIFRLAYILRKKLDRHPPTRKYNLPRVSSTTPVTMNRKRTTRALKRYCMYFRWMVRDSEPDFGIWNFFDKKNLWHPLDTHVAKILKRWGVLSGNSPNWLNVEKVTEYFRIIEPSDPLKFDYHLVTFGQKFCRKNDPLCWKCPIKPQFKCELKFIIKLKGYM